MNQLHFFLPEFKLKSLLMNMFKSILLLINLALFTLPFTKNHPIFMCKLHASEFMRTTG